MGCHFPLQGIFLTQGSNQCLLRWQADSLSLSHLGSPEDTLMVALRQETNNKPILQASPPGASQILAGWESLFNNPATSNPLTAHCLVIALSPLAFKHVCVCTQTNGCVYVFTCTEMHKCVHMFIHTHTSVYLYVQIPTHKYVLIYVCRHTHLC